MRYPEPSGDTVDPHFHLMEASGRAGGGLKTEDVDDFLFAKHLVEVVIQIVRVAKDVSTGRLGEKKERLVRADGRSRLQIVLHAHPADVDRMQHHV